MSAESLPVRGSENVPAIEATAIAREIQQRTPARLLVGRSGLSYRTGTQLELRRDHAAALDAVHAEINAERDFGKEFVKSWKLFTVQTQARDKAEYLMRPDLGRKLSDPAVAEITRRCVPGVDLQVVLGDGLSATALAMQAPDLLPLLDQVARRAGWSFGQPFVVRHCRVGILNGVGDLLRPKVAVLLIGERPGLATAESLSAYMAYEPGSGHTDANRNLISNIHRRGVSCPEAARRIAALAQRMIDSRASGVAIKEDMPALPDATVARRPFHRK